MSELQMLRFQLTSWIGGLTGQQRHRQGDQGGLFEQGEHGGQGPRGQAAAPWRSCSGLGVQKKGYTLQIKDLTHELKESRENEQRLEQLLDERERHARAQVIAVKQLRQTCEELEEGNNRLMLASDVYSRPVQPAQPEQPHVSPVTAHSQIIVAPPSSLSPRVSSTISEAATWWCPPNPRNTASSQSGGYNSPHRQAERSETTAAHLVGACFSRLKERVNVELCISIVV